jgi:nucleoside-diphosphate-sugar epimerase
VNIPSPSLIYDLVRSNPIEMSPAIPKDSIVLVTGVNGYIGSHVADQLMEAGYRVRGTARSASKVKDLGALWEKKFGHGRFEVAIVKDMSHEGAFDEAIKGVSGIAHIASNVSADPNPNNVIPEVISWLNGILQSAAKEPSVKRFVYTSSSVAAANPKPGVEFIIDSNSWNEEAIKDAWAPPPYPDDRKWAVYASSKAEAEKALWKFSAEQKPNFVVNAVLPNCNFGKILVKGQPVSTGRYPIELFKGNIGPIADSNLPPLAYFPPQWFVDVQDVARLHVAALINPEVKNERIFAFAYPFNKNDLLRALKKVRPDRKFVDEFPDENVRDVSKVANERAEELLKALGRPGWTSLEDSLKANVEWL